MQSSMNNQSPNSLNSTEPSSGKSWVGKTQIEKGLSSLSSIADTDFRAMADDISGKVREVSGPVFRESVSFVRRHPVGSALGLGLVGFILGTISARSRR